MGESVLYSVKKYEVCRLAWVSADPGVISAEPIGTVVPHTPTIDPEQDSQSEDSAGIINVACSALQSDNKMMLRRW